MSDRPSEQRPNLTISAALSMPLPEAEERMPIRRSEWKRLRTQASRLVNPVANASNWVAFFAGSAVSAFLAWLPWQASRSDTPPSERESFAWVSPALLSACAACVVVGAIILYYDRKMRRHLGTGVKAFCEDMDAIEQAHPHDSTSPSS